MKKILIIFFVFHHCLLFGQILDKTYYPAPRPLGRKVPIDTCRMAVTYDFEFVKDDETMVCFITHSSVIAEIITPEQTVLPVSYDEILF